MFLRFFWYSDAGPSLERQTWGGGKLESEPENQVKTKFFTRFKITFIFYLISQDFFLSSPGFLVPILSFCQGPLDCAYARGPILFSDAASKIHSSRSVEIESGSEKTEFLKLRFPLAFSALAFSLYKSL